ncbi:MAG: hypothetical protein ACRCS8_05365 [Brevinema sp.]
MSRIEWNDIKKESPLIKPLGEFQSDQYPRPNDFRTFFEIMKEIKNHTDLDFTDLDTYIWRSLNLLKQK